MFIHTPIAGFSTISFFAYGREIHVHGFFQSEVRENVCMTLTVF